MSVTYHQSKPPPWESGGPKIERYASGLIRVMQSYLVPSAQSITLAERFRQGQELTGIESPATDGLFIFPEPSIEDQNNGFCKINVTAYGRANQNFNIELTYARIFRTFNEGTEGEYEQEYFVPTYRMQQISKSGDPPIPPTLSELRYKDAFYIVINGSLIQTNPTPATFDFRYDFSPAASYGEFQEVTYFAYFEPIAEPQL